MSDTIGQVIERLEAKLSHHEDCPDKWFCHITVYVGDLRALLANRKITEGQARRLWDKIQEDGESLDFETFWERLKEVFEP